MRCPICHTSYDDNMAKCPACGEPKPAAKPVQPPTTNGTSGYAAAPATSSLDNVFDMCMRSTIILTTLSGKGTGFFVRHMGQIYCITNAHVVDNERYLTGTFHRSLDSTGQGYTMRVLAVDPLNDIALLQMQNDASGLPSVSGRGVLTLGKQSDIRIGEEVCTMGNPRHLNGVLTVGRISSVDSCMRPEHTRGANLFMVNITVTSGNSGGPVVNRHGEVLGMITSLYENIPNEANCESVMAIQQLLYSYKNK